MLDSFEEPVCSGNERGCRGYDFVGVGKVGDVIGDDLRVVEAKIGVELGIEAEEGLIVKGFA